jgi:hypothetical protein
MDPNSHEALVRRREAATLTSRVPTAMLLAFVWVSAVGSVGEHLSEL